MNRVDVADLVVDLVDVDLDVDLDVYLVPRPDLFLGRRLYFHLGPRAPGCINFLLALPAVFLYIGPIVMYAGHRTCSMAMDRCDKTILSKSSS